MQENDTSQNNHTTNAFTQARRGNIPRLAMINDIAGFGRCSTTVSLPIISAMEVQVCPVPTSILSNHLGFPLCRFDDYTPHMREYISVWKQLGLTFDGLYCGFLGSVEQIAIVEEFLTMFQPELFLLDPVMGDHGKAYSTVTKSHCRDLKKLASKADILTPNLTEACLLTDMPYQENPTDEALDTLCEKLAILCPRSQIVITGIRREDILLNLVLLTDPDGSPARKRITCAAPIAGASRPGTGDIFASILTADALHKRDLCSSVRKAADFIALCIKCSEEAGTPVREGVLFERCLYELITAQY